MSPQPACCMSRTGTRCGHLERRKRPGHRWPARSRVDQATTRGRRSPRRGMPSESCVMRRLVAAGGEHEGESAARRARRSVRLAGWLAGWRRIRRNWRAWALESASAVHSSASSRQSPGAAHTARWAPTPGLPVGATCAVISAVGTGTGSLCTAYSEGKRASNRTAASAGEYGCGSAGSTPAVRAGSRRTGVVGRRAAGCPRVGRTARRRWCWIPPRRSAPRRAKPSAMTPASGPSPQASPAGRHQ